jgi:hypothetical protein
MKLTLVGDGDYDLCLLDILAHQCLIMDLETSLGHHSGPRHCVATLLECHRSALRVRQRGSRHIVGWFRRSYECHAGGGVCEGNNCAIVCSPRFILFCGFACDSAGLMMRMGF